ncbi:MAG: L,D-transpeptidase [Lachnospiraceae bacterium]|nr:L,D-transpeptidase [Lachnospiraceae bacterium]
MSRVETHQKKRKLKKRRIFITAAVVLAVYFTGFFFFNTHFYPGTRVGEMKIGGRSIASAKQFLEEKLSERTVTIEEPEGEEKISAEDAGLTYTNPEILQQILKKQNGKIWFWQWKDKHRYDALEVQVNQDRLSASVDGLQCMNPENPIESSDAFLEYDSEQKTYVIREGSLGNIVEKDHFIQGITEAFLNGEKMISLKDSTYYKQPEYTASSREVLDAQQTLNQYLGGTVTYEDGNQKVKLSKKEISKCLECSEDFQVSVSKTKVKAFVKDKVVKNFNSVEGTIPTGLTAWKVDETKEIESVINTITSGKAEKRKPVYETEGFDRADSDIDKTYIDVNLSRQKMWYVEDGKVALSSDVVTGNISTGHGTGTGLYRIAYKQRDHLMVKYNSFVHYWMPYNTKVGIGFHDASWRSSFGGDIYRTNGSHGCINMPPAKAEELYNLISEGTLVYLHW